MQHKSKRLNKPLLQITDLNNLLFQSRSVIQFSCTPFSGEVHATRAFMVLAIMAYIAAIGFVVLMHIKKDLDAKFLGAILVVACKSLKLEISITHGTT